MSRGTDPNSAGDLCFFIENLPTKPFLSHKISVPNENQENRATTGLDQISKYGFEIFDPSCFFYNKNNTMVFNTKVKMTCWVRIGSASAVIYYGTPIW